MRGFARPMQFFLLGLAALLLSLLVLRGFTVANPQVLVGQLRAGVGIAALVGACFLVLRGLVGYAVSLAALGSWLLWGAGAAPWATPGGAQQSPGQTSRVSTEYLEVELDHDTGDMRGRVLKGVFAGRALQDLSPLRSEEHTSELQSRGHLVCRLLLEKKKENVINGTTLPKQNTNQ